MPTVLVVDDTPVDRRLAGGILEQLNGVKVAYATDGEDACSQLAAVSPDLIVTDLQMPNMDGLELVNRIRMQFPKTPVVLMTARGSEEVAVAALEQGASSYVPKSQLHESLTSTVEDLLAMATSDKMHSELMSCQQSAVFSYSLTNKVELISVLVDLVQQMLEGMEFTDHTGKMRIGIALREALLNALFHGNLELGPKSKEAAGEIEAIVGKRRDESPYNERRIHVEVQINSELARFTVRDDGAGFDHASVQIDPKLLAADSSQGGRGLVLMHTFTDELSFNGAGNEVTMIKRRDP